MFRTTYQKGFLSIFYSLGSRPLGIWRTCVKNGHIKRLADDDINSLALEIIGTNVATTYITTPREPKAMLGIRLPFLILLVKNMRKFFSFEVTVLDDKNFQRRFRVSNYQCKTRVKTFGTSMPLALSPGWNQIQFNLADFTRRAYGTNYLETVRLQVHANVRIRRIYFSDCLYPEDQLPTEYRIMTFSNLKQKSNTKRPSKPEARPSTPEAPGHGGGHVQDQTESGPPPTAESVHRPPSAATIMSPPDAGPPPAPTPTPSLTAHAHEGGDGGEHAEEGAAEPPAEEHPPPEEEAAAE